MVGSPEKNFQLPPEQQAIRDKCFHPSGTFVEFPMEDIETSIPARFEKIVRMYPERIAVKMGDRMLSYDELNRAANRVAAALLEKRGPVSEPVVLLFEQCIEAVTAILGVLKAGKFYVAVDVSFPLQRINQIIENCRAGVFLSHDRHADLARRLSDRDCDVINIHEIDTSSTRDKNPTTRVSSGSLASILYTSGSTGRPKGIAHSHRSQLHTVMVNTNEARICHQDKLTLIHSLGFGSAQANLFQALLNGACLCSFHLKSESIQRLAKWLKQEAITVYHSPPAVLRQLAEATGEAETLSNLRLIRLSGTAISRFDHDLYKNTFAPGALLQVVMNSTEANVICSFFSDGSFSFPERGSPAGYPVQGKKILWLDENGCEIDAQESGEIAIQSAYLPVGSWDDVDPKALQMGGDPRYGGERTILTGDIGRPLADGLLIYLGRKDAMVKIRGYRVEIGEVERALLSHPAVSEGAVAAWERDAGDKYLVGYVVPQKDQTPTTESLREYLQEKLPSYMMPASFMFLDLLPLTNGKLDRKALPLPARTRPDSCANYVAPRTPTEAKLAAIWAEVLQLDRVGVHDPFFELGGNSLSAMRVFHRVLQSFNLDLSVRVLFDAPTVAETAAIIVRSEVAQLSEEALDKMLREVEAMTEEEAQRQLTSREPRETGSR